MARKAQLSATFQVDGRCRADFAFGARIVPLGRVGSLQRTQTSGAPPARRPPGWRAAPSPRSMRTRYQTRAARPQKWGVSAISPYLGLFAGRCRADFAFGALIVPQGRVGSPQRTQTSGAKRRLRGACKFQRATQTRAAPAYALRVSVSGKPHRKWDGGFALLKNSLGMAEKN
jgi:hypothetical protein